MKALEKIRGWKDTKKTLFWLIVIYSFVFLATIPLYFFRSESGFKWGSINLGWLVGALVSILAYWMIARFSESVVAAPGEKKGHVSMTLVGYGIRFLLYIAVLVVSAICTFKPEWFGGFDMISFWGAMPALVIMPFVTLITHLLALRRGEIVQTEKPEDTGDINQ